MGPVSNGAEPGVEDVTVLNGHAESMNDGATHEAPPFKVKQTLHTIKKKTKAKTKRIFHPSSPKPSDEKQSDRVDDIQLSIRDDPAFNPGKVIKEQRVTASGITDTTIGALRTVTTAVVHPKRAIVNKAARTTAGKLSKTERPISTLQSDLEFLEAHEDLHRAQFSEHSRRTSMSMDMDEDDLTHSCRGRVEELEAHREKLLAAWTTSKNVERVRVVPKRHIQFPEREAFIERDDQGKVLRYRWEKWLGYILLHYTQDFSAQYVDDFDELPFDVLTVRKNLQRLMMASAPWQAWFMDVRSVYRWEDPWKTGKWSAVFLVLWYTEHLMGFVWFYILYLVLKNRYYPTTYRSLKESMNRALDQKSTAYKLGELIDKHGPDGWIEPLMDDLGPFIQLQLGDVANMLEVFINFYGWKSPRKTRDTLIFFAACLLVSLLADVKFCMKIFWFVCGGAFFISWPVASHHPKYRYLVSPFKWILWDIPTHAEWSFQHLRRQAQISREEMIKQKVERNHITESIQRSSRQSPPMPTLEIEDYDHNSESDDDDWHSVTSSTSILDSSDIISFRAEWHKTVGRLIIYSSGIRFVRSLPKKELWRKSFLELTEMRKTRGSSISKITMMAVQQLELTFIDGGSVTVEILMDRDEAFNTIIGFSALQWQVLQPGPGKGNGTGSGGNGRLFGRL